jgi:transposase
MQTISTIGLDIAKSVFQVHGIDATGQVLVRRQLKRRQVLGFFQRLPPCLVGIEACAIVGVGAKRTKLRVKRTDLTGASFTPHPAVARCDTLS